MSTRMEEERSGQKHCNRFAHTACNMLYYIQSYAGGGITGGDGICLLYHGDGSRIGNKRLSIVSEIKIGAALWAALD